MCQVLNLECINHALPSFEIEQKTRLAKALVTVLLYAMNVSQRRKMPTSPVLLADWQAFTALSMHFKATCSQ